MLSSMNRNQGLALVGGGLFTLVLGLEGWIVDDVVLTSEVHSQTSAFQTMSAFIDDWYQSTICFSRGGGEGLDHHKTKRQSCDHHIIRCQTPSRDFVSGH